MWINRAGSAEKAWRRRENAHKLSTILCKRNKRFHDTVSLCAQEAALGFSAGSISRSSALYSLHCRRKRVARRSGLRAASPALFARVCRNFLYAPFRTEPGLVRLPSSLYHKKGGITGRRRGRQAEQTGRKCRQVRLFGPRRAGKRHFSGAFMRMRPEAPSSLCYPLQKGGRACFFGDPCQKRVKTSPQC